MGDVVLITGGTGFVGTEVVARLLQRPDTEIISLVPASSDAGAIQESIRAWWHRPDLRAAVGSRVRVVAGDVVRPGFGMESRILAELRPRVTHIVHAAADLRVDASLEELRRTNVDGVAHVLRFARSVPRLSRLVHVSTAYVAGRRRGVVREDDLSDAYGFASPYEQTKFEGERLVRAAASELPVVIVRPSMIVGDSKTGRVKTYNTFYTPLRLLLFGRLPVIPASRHLRVNIVPVDYVADAIVRLAFDPAATGLTFHVVTPIEELPTAAEVVRVARRWARRGLGVRLLPPAFVPLPVRLPGRTGRVLTPYLHERRRFRRDRTDAVLGGDVPDWHRYLPLLLEDAAAHGFLHRSNRTVHEQVVFRLKSSRRPVRIVDIGTDGTSTPRPAAEIRRDIARAVASLRALGVRHGTRVAIVGPNGSRNLVIDVATGLAGGVTVPIYPTTPPGELDDILRRSGAALLFIGSATVLERVAELSATVPIVSFCGGDPGTDRAVVPWSAFLVAGAGRDADDGGVGPDDLATIRYTSGTTGPPKGVAFTHAQLRWMAETMASLVPWRARTRPSRYVSFLPVSHVVEGILGAYGPYYLPAPVDVTFLEDFRLAASVLPRVRPTVFFSVPRVYQKVWDRFEGSWLGTRYLRAWCPMRAVLRPIARRGVLRRAGLGACAQLLVGSAPADEALLAAFQGLGIEIHDAYGLTEAPLVALNRAGRNRSGTVGEPLPETDVRIAEDGEVMVRGPQVTTGYVGEDVQPVHDGWLATGDLGHLTGEGRLVIDGRKKDLLKTAYGKYLQPSKIEARLRRIPGVAEAMVVGEGRPFCAALLWTEGLDDAAIDAAVNDVNLRLSHPEQVKRWALLRNDLSVENGDLTANFKLRRRQVQRRFGDVIESLYGSHPAGAVRSAVRAEVSR